MVSWTIIKSNQLRSPTYSHLKYFSAPIPHVLCPYGREFPAAVTCCVEPWELALSLPLQPGWRKPCEINLGGCRWGVKYEMVQEKPNHNRGFQRAVCLMEEWCLNIGCIFLCGQKTCWHENDLPPPTTELNVFYISLKFLPLFSNI